MIEFCNRLNGRIAVFTKGNNSEVENVFRVGTIVYSVNMKEHQFFQGLFGIGTRIDGNTMILIGEKLKELDLMKR